MEPPSIPVQSSPPTRLRRHSGSGSVEFAIAVIPVVLLGFGTMELARWLYVKQALSLALLDAARAGITQNARPRAIETAFNKALEPLYPPTSSHTASQRVQARGDGMRAGGLAPWRIELLSPSPAAYEDFSDGSLAISRETGFAAINNNYQEEQDHARRAMGWPDGAGPASGQTIYQANQLVLRLTYPHKPLTPGVSGLLRMLAADASGYAGKAFAQGYLPISQEIELTMQSHPVDWPTDGGLVVGPHDGTATASPAKEPCRGLWCLERAGGPAGSIPWEDPDPPLSDALTDAGHAPGDPTASPPAASDTGLEVAPDDPACGLTLCCLA